ncbi:MAG: hypothetical protein GYA33_08330 [Thermogutta sp.]|nr:hypothetical protein [Thermogutta sp.]
MKFLVAINSLLRTLAALVFVGLLVAVAYFGYTEYFARERAQQAMKAELDQTKETLARTASELEQRREQVSALTEQVADLRSEVAEKQKQIERLQTAVRLLKVDRRVAYLDCLELQPGDDGNPPRAKLRFVEIDPHGRPVGEPRLLEVAGDKVYVDALVVKFEDRLVEESDPLRAASLCLFQRIFGDRQSPAEGVPVDAEDQQPQVYRSGEAMTEFERELWGQFWDYARDEQKAKAAGIRAAHGQAVYLAMEPGTRYKITIRASDGLTLTREGPIPADVNGAL